jgi:hypothetical protein
MQMSPALNQRWLPQPSSPRLTHSSGYSSNCSCLRTEMESAHVEIPISNPLLHVAKKNPIPIPSNFNSPILKRSETFSQWHHAAPSLPFHLVDLLSHLTIDLQLRDSVSVFCRVLIIAWLSISEFCQCLRDIHVLLHFAKKVQDNATIAYLSARGCRNGLLALALS